MSLRRQELRLPGLHLSCHRSAPRCSTKRSKIVVRQLNKPFLNFVPFLKKQVSFLQEQRNLILRKTTRRRRVLRKLDIRMIMQ